MNLRLRCHVPLYSPNPQLYDCSMKIAGEVLTWKEGECIIFDDSFEHEVWNYRKDQSTPSLNTNTTEGERVILLFDLWHPELTNEEKLAIIDMFEYARKQGWLS